MNPWATVVAGLGGAAIAGLIALILDARRRSSEVLTRTTQQAREDNLRWHDEIRKSTADLIAICWSARDAKLALYWTQEEIAAQTMAIQVELEQARSGEHTNVPDLTRRSKQLMDMQTEATDKILRRGALSREVIAAKARLDLISPDSIRNNAATLVKSVNSYLNTNDRMSPKSVTLFHTVLSNQTISLVEFVSAYIAPGQELENT